MHGMPLAVASAQDNLDNQINHLDAETQKLWEQSKSLGIDNAPNLDLQDLVDVSVRDTEEAENSLIS